MMLMNTFLHALGIALVCDSQTVKEESCSKEGTRNACST